jgi:hypothetical protein
VLLLTQKIKAAGKVHEDGSRQTIAAIQGGKVRFESSLELKLDDGRVRQGDAVTTYKAQGASRTVGLRASEHWRRIRPLVPLVRQDQKSLARRAIQALRKNLGEYKFHSGW